MIKILNAYPGMGDPMTEEEVKNFLANKNNKLLVRLGIIDIKGEPNIVPLAYYFDDITNKIYITTRKTTKKIRDLRERNDIAYCIDDPNPPFKGVRGKGTVKIHDNDVNYNISIAEKLMTKLTGSLDNPNAKWVINEIKKGNNVILEITPTYYSTWRSAVPTT